MTTFDLPVVVELDDTIHSAAANDILSAGGTSMTEDGPEGEPPFTRLDAIESDLQYAIRDAVEAALARHNIPGDLSGLHVGTLTARRAESSVPSDTEPF